MWFAFVACIKLPFDMTVLKQKLVTDGPWAISDLYLNNQWAKKGFYIFKKLCKKKKVYATETICDMQNLDYLLSGL